MDYVQVEHMLEMVTCGHKIRDANIRKENLTNLSLDHTKIDKCFKLNKFLITERRMNYAAVGKIRARYSVGELFNLLLLEHH